MAVVLAGIRSNFYRVRVPACRRGRVRSGFCRRRLRLVPAVAGCGCGRFFEQIAQALGVVKHAGSLQNRERVAVGGLLSFLCFGLDRGIDQGEFLKHRAALGVEFCKGF
jgi:hypothetical protein